MVESVKRLCTVNARAGSKGLPGKNLAIVAGMPLIAHTLEQAKKTGIFDILAVSSDSMEVLEVAKGFGALTIERPAHLAGDSAAKMLAIVHGVEEAERISGVNFTIVADLDATSPLRNCDDIVGAVRLLETQELDSVFSGTHARKSAYFNQVMKGQNGQWGPVAHLETPIIRRQDSPETFDLNASIYVWRKSALLRNPSVFQQSSALYLMPEERSWDIDSEFDLEVVRCILERNRMVR